MHPLAHLNQYFIAYWRLFVPGLLLTMLSAVFAIGVPMVVRQGVDSIPRFVTLYRQFEGTEAQAALFGDLFWTFMAFGLIVIGLSVASGFCSFLMRQTVIVASRHIEFDMRNKLYDHLQKLPQSFYNEMATGDVITRSTSDIEQVRRYIGPAIMYLTRALVIVITAIIVMLVISPRLTLYALMPMPLLGIAIFILAQMVHERSDALQQQYSRLTSRVQEALSGIRVLKAYALEETEAAAFDSESNTYKARMLDMARAEAGWRPVFVLVVGLSEILVLWVGARLVTEGAITIGNIAEYMIYVALMTWPVAALGMVISMMQRATVSVQRIHAVLDTKPAILGEARPSSSSAVTGSYHRANDLKAPPKRAPEHLKGPEMHSPQIARTYTATTGHLIFENVSFRYGDDRPWALRDISVDLPAGRMLAIVGRTGSGKSTLVQHIGRLLDPVQGRILLDGQDIRSLPLEELRGKIGYVLQDPFLFRNSVGENISFGTLDASPDDIEQAAHEAELLDNVLDFPKGFETTVGERGVTMSGGQKQRITIARALIRNPQILILDDALSSVDTSTESRILRNLRRRRGRQTLMIVSHRISSVQNANHILVLDEGRISEQGTHEELVVQGGLYAQLYERQLLEEELAAM